MNSIYLLLLLATCLYQVLACPEQCHCLPTASAGHLQVVCHWSRIPPDPFQNFPSNVTRSLSIQCTQSLNDTQSVYSNSMFAKFFSLKHLKLIGCAPADRKLPEGIFQGLDSLETLYMTALGPELSIPAGALGGLNQVHSITLTSSGVKNVPGGGLCHLSQLKLLNLTDNLINNVHASGIDHNNCKMDQLILLDLSHNRISQLGMDEMNGLVSLHVLQMDHNQITSIDKRAFHNSTLLQRLHLSHNQLEKLEKLPPSLRLVDLSYNRLNMLLPTFSDMPSLQQLNVSHNFIDSSLPFTLQAPKLEQLDLSSNDVSSVSQHIFSNVSSLVELHLGNNHIHSLQHQAFINLPNLQRLYIQNNKLTILQTKHLAGATNLTLLDLRNNSLVSLEDEVFHTNTNITDLMLGNNLLLEVPTALTRLYKLHNLDLSDNKLAAIHKFLFDKLPNLRVLDLAENQLKNIDRYVFEGMVQLEELDLSDNAIETLSPQCFDRCPKLRIIKLQENLLTGMQGVFTRLTHLQMLNLTDNQITFLDFAMLPPSLTDLLISKNELSQVTNIVGDRKLQLYHLDCSDNKLTGLKSNILPHSLKTANFSTNKIRSLQGEFLRGKSELLWIDLRYNSVQELNMSNLVVPKNAQQQARVLLEGNPLLCSCNMLWIKRMATVIHPSHAQIEDYQRLKCTHSASGEITFIQNMQDQDFLCQYEVKCAQDCLCCDFDGCDCKNVCPIGCNCFHDQVMLTNVVRCSHRNESLPFSPVNIPMLASHIYLDGMKLGAVAPHAFFGRYRNTHLYLNASHIDFISPLAFNGLTSLQVLDLSDNELLSLTGKEFVDTPKLMHLFLNGNKLQYLPSELFQKLPNLVSLTLHRNRFSILPPSLPTLPNLQAVTLAFNFWYCDCNDRFQIQSWLPGHRDLVKDAPAVTCYQDLPPSRNITTVLVDMSPVGDDVRINFWAFHNELSADLCHSSVADVPQTELKTRPIQGVEAKPSHLTWGLVAFSTILALVLIVIVVYRMRKRMQSWSRYKSPPSLNSSITNSTPVPITTALIHYDAFVCYSKSDENWVLGQLTSQLENEPPFYHLSLLHRDLPMNSPFQLIQDNLIRAMERSQCLVLVLTPNFLQYEGDSVQVRTALEYVFKQKGRRVIAIRLDDSVNLDCLDPDLGKQLRTSTRLKWGDPCFWDDLRNVLPHKSPNSDCSTSAHYSDMYGPPVPSEFV